MANFGDITCQIQSMRSALHVGGMAVEPPTDFRVDLDRCGFDAEYDKYHGPVMLS